MPLHLLGKKSWNVYNPASIARVRQDEADAQAREEAAEQRMQEQDAERRIALLRGEKPPALPEPEGEEEYTGKRRREDGHGREKKRKKLRGEDETDMDLHAEVSPGIYRGRAVGQSRSPSDSNGTRRWAVERQV